MDTIAPGRGAVSPLWVEDHCPQQAIDWGRAGGAQQSDASAAWAAALESAARGLLNLTAFASRCEERAADEGEREQWRREILKAREQLEGLYRAGLPRDFLKETSAVAGGAGLPHPGTLPTGAGHETEEAKGPPRPPVA